MKKTNIITSEELLVNRLLAEDQFNKSYWHLDKNGIPRRLDRNNHTWQKISINNKNAIRFKSIASSKDRKTYALSEEGMLYQYSESRNRFEALTTSEGDELGEENKIVERLLN